MEETSRYFGVTSSSRPTQTKVSAASREFIERNQMMDHEDQRFQIITSQSQIFFVVFFVGMSTISLMSIIASQSIRAA